MKLSQNEVRWLFSHLRNVDFLQFYTSEELEELISKTEKLIFEAGKTIIRQGETGKNFFILYHGRVSVSISSEGVQKNITTLQSGDFFGEISLLTESKCTANVKAEERSDIFIIGRDEFKRAVLKNPKLAQIMSQTIARRKSEIDSLMSELPVDEDKMFEKMKKHFGC